VGLGYGLGDTGWAAWGRWSPYGVRVSATGWIRKVGSNAWATYISATGLTALSSVTLTPNTPGPWALNVYAYNSGYALIASGVGSSTPTMFRVKATSTTVPTTDSAGVLTLTNLGGVTAVADPLSSGRGYVLYFNGTSYLETTSVVNTTSASTRTFWIYTTTPSFGDGSIFFNPLFRIFFGNTVNLYVSLTGQTSPQPYEWYYATTLSTSAWTFVAVTSTGTTSSMYINGSLVTVTRSDNGTTTTSIPMAYAGEQCLINFGYDAYGYYKGYLDDLRQYNYVLTPTQITGVMNLTY